MNLPLWVKLSKYPIDQNVIKLEGKFMPITAGIQCIELTAPKDEKLAPTTALSGTNWRCKRKSARLQIGMFRCTIALLPRCRNKTVTII